MLTKLKDKIVKTDYDAVIVGAGFSGLYMLHKLRKLGLRVVVFERGDGIGGTWFWNRYPGARCDVQSLEYSYHFDDSLQQEWEWPERYSAQPDILAYINYVARKFDLQKDVVLDNEVKSASYDQNSGKWNISSTKELASAQFCVMATGCLSSTNSPNFSGLEKYTGETLHTGLWPKEKVNLRGKEVGIIGTGSSAIQSIPIIAQEAKHLHVFQRTPNYSVPAQNHKLEEEQNLIKQNYSTYRKKWEQEFFAFGVNEPAGEAASASKETLLTEYEKRWEEGGLMFLGAFSDLIIDDNANKTARDFIKNKIKQIVKDPATAKKLLPNYSVGCKRLCADTGYYETFNKPNVSLIDVSENIIKEFTKTGLLLSDGTSYELDSCIFATGFDAMTGSLDKIQINGKNGLSLKEKWGDGPKTYLGLGISGFPNLFHIAGPGSPSVLTNMMASIQQHVEWIADCINWMSKNGYTRIEAEDNAENDWVNHVNEVAEGTIYPSCNSWYLGANIPGKTRQFMPYIGGYPYYVKKCNEVASRGYDGFSLS